MGKVNYVGIKKKTLNGTHLNIYFSNIIFNIEISIFLSWLENDATEHGVDHSTYAVHRAVHGTREYRTDPKNRTEIIPN